MKQFTTKKEYEKFHVGTHVFVFKNNKLLLGKRKNVYGAGSWGLPGGHLESGEKIGDRAKKELLEEINLKAERFEFVCLVNDNREDQHYIQIGFLAKDIKGEVVLNEPDRCEEWKWFDVNDLPKNIFASAKDIIQAFIKKSSFIDN